MPTPWVTKKFQHQLRDVCALGLLLIPLFGCVPQIGPTGEEIRIQEQEKKEKALQAKLNGPRLEMQIMVHVNEKKIPNSMTMKFIHRQSPTSPGMSCERRRIRVRISKSQLIMPTVSKDLRFIREDLEKRLKSEQGKVANYRVAEILVREQLEEKWMTQIKEVLAQASFEKITVEHVGADYIFD